MALATFVATRAVVRGRWRGWAGRGEATHIEFEKRGVKLRVNDVPVESGRLVSAVNDALRRLDAGYARHQHFLARAADELRTPIAILMLGSRRRRRSR